MTNPIEIPKRVIPPLKGITEVSYDRNGRIVKLTRSGMKILPKRLRKYNQHKPVADSKVANYNAWLDIISMRRYKRR